MARPAWLPSSLPTAIRDFVGDFVAVMPDFLPRRYTRRAADIYLEFQALGESVAYWRELLEWFMRTFLPQHDSEGMWLSRHERDYGLRGGGLTDSEIDRRQRAILAAMRNRGTLTTERAQAILAPIYDVPPDEIAFATVAIKDLLASHYLVLNPSERDWHRAVDAYSIHVYHSLETVIPDQNALQAELSKLSQSGERWTGGQTKKFLWGTDGSGWGGTYIA